MACLERERPLFGCRCPEQCVLCPAPGCDRTYGSGCGPLGGVGLLLFLCVAHAGHRLIDVPLLAVQELLYVVGAALRPAGLSLPRVAARLAVRDLRLPFGEIAAG